MFENFFISEDSLKFLFKIWNNFLLICPCLSVKMQGN